MTLMFKSNLHPNSEGFFFVYDGLKYLVQLPKHIDYGSLVRCAKKKFKLTGKSSLIGLSYKIDRNKVSIKDDDDVVYFVNEVFESSQDIKSLYIAVLKEAVEVSHTSSAEPLDLDLNIPLFDEQPNNETSIVVHSNEQPDSKNESIHYEHKWKNNTFQYTPVPPNPPSFVKNPKKQPFFSSHVLKVFEEFEDKDECIREIALKCLKEVRGANIFRITHMNDVHTCLKLTVNGNHSNATTKVLGHMLVPKMRDTTRVYKPKDIQLDMNLALNIDISYKKAWRGKQLALQATQGCPKVSYEQLPYYFHYLKLANEGTVTHIDTDDEGRFKQCFLAFGVAVRSFLRFMRPLLIIDAAHLKGRYLGTNLAAVAMDGNNQIIPIATGVTHGETGESWTWFLSKLKECIGEVLGLAIISDRHFAIGHACKNVFPNAFHGYCCRHLMMNCNMQSDRLKGLYWKTCKAYTRAEFDRCVACIRVMRPAAYRKLEDAGFEKWSRAYCPANRYNYMTSNSVESINSLTREVRRVPITMLMDWYRQLLQRWYFERRSKYEDALDEEVSDWATAKIYDRIIKSVNWTVKGIHKMNKYEVKDNRRDWFLRTTLKNTYSGMFNPTQDVATWETRDDLQVVLAPVIIKRQAGRPKNKDRIRSQGEEPVRKQCTRCGANGHNRGSCNVPLVTKKRCATRKMRSLRALCRVPRIANGRQSSSTRNENLNNAAPPESTNQQAMNVPTPPASIGMINRLSQMSTPQNFLV
ncbi:transposase, MuDR, MULE transposase domain protein [Artemisia annua]|uniref:Transposase, MuDR, MULE transposase domain protein n=1 Tax=Artemisia annua TaxID=35608 RepID=A0A2U1PIJ5_ARTAN|nr:transposase, MuDR, MULE transposase domain protein [Artemisia annua]